MTVHFPVIAHASSSASQEIEIPSSGDKRKREELAPLPFIETLHNPLRTPYMVFIGDHPLRATLQAHFDQIGLLHRVMPDGLFWSRDARIISLDENQTHLISAPFNQSLHEIWFFGLLPIDMIHFRITPYSGQGIFEKVQAEARKVAHFYQAPSRNIETCLEGGNCLLFKGVDGKPSAIVGYSSVILSLISLFHKNYFNAFQSLKRSREEREFSSDEIRVAKKFYSLLKGSKYVAENLERTQKWTQKVVQMIQITKEQIASDLQIPLSRIAFVSQESFHIDMDMFPGPDGIVFIHDESQMLEIQESIGEKSIPFLAKTIRGSNGRLPPALKRLNKNIEILKNIGCTPVAVPGVLRMDFQPGEKVDYDYMGSHWMQPDCLPCVFSETEKTPLAEENYTKIEFRETSYLINFMNGLLVQNTKGKNYFFTAAAPNSPALAPFTEAFLSKVHKACPNLEVIFLEGELQETLIKHHGSIHCMTSTSA